MKIVVYLANFVLFLLLLVCVVSNIAMIARADKQTAADPGMQLGSVLSRGVTLLTGAPMLVSVLSMIILTCTLKRYTKVTPAITVLRILLIIVSLVIASLSFYISISYSGVNLHISDLLGRLNHATIPVLVFLQITHFRLLVSQKRRSCGN